jgi:phosphoadenosine phosphosulfate reductase
VSRPLISAGPAPPFFVFEDIMTAALDLAFLHPDYLAPNAPALHQLYDASDGLDHLARHAGAALDGATPQEILRWAIDRFGQRFVIASSMEDGVLAHMAGQIHPGVRVVFLDTGYHFAETVGTADAVETVTPIELLRVRPEQTVAEQDATYGADLWSRDPDLCCRLRKVLPLRRALAPYVAWASGIRRDEADTRRDVKVVDWDAERQMVKVNPLAGWTQEQVDDYIQANGVLVNPLLSDGYGSVGCAPCTRRGAGREGRWAGTGKVECGLHV